ncbi:MAG: SRPBCC family protein [Vulcanimicrobiaceae bacterium]
MNITNTTEIVATRMIPAPSEKVFDAWIDPKSPGGPGFGAKSVILSPAVDGLFYLAVEHEGRTWPHYGRFMRLERPRLLEHTWVSEATKGSESVVTLTLQPDGDATLVTLRHSGVPDDELGRQHKEGWTWILEMLAERFAQSSSMR